MDMKEDISKAKRSLYLLLLKCNYKELTNNEIELLFRLSTDNDIQSIIKDKKSTL